VKDGILFCARIEENGDKSVNENLIALIFHRNHKGSVGRPGYPPTGAKIADVGEKMRGYCQSPPSSPATSCPRRQL
jgi:hypothetical protein